MVQPVYLAATAVALVASVLCLFHAWKEDHVTFYLTTLIYGLLLEKAAITAFQTYSYPAEKFLLSVYGIPVAIGLAWAAIIYTGYITALKAELERWLIPVFAGLYVLHIDIAIDAIAIRIPLWTWTPPGPWFGVPLGNFMAWYLVAFLFVGSFLYLRDRIDHHGGIALATLLSSTVLLIGLLELWEVLTANILYREVAILVAVILLSVAALARSENIALWKEEVLMLEPFLAIILIHLFYLGVLFAFGFYRETPVLVVVSVLMVIIGILVHWFPHIKDRVPL